MEPLFARLVLPLLGGSPAVWNICLMSFQVLLLLGYLYAHFSSRYLPPRKQVLLHSALLVACLVALPVSIPRGWTPPPSGNVIPWLLLVLSFSIGAPFLVLSATAPLLQRWLSIGPRPIENPYVLYAASNAGSFLGLLAFPFLLEPRLRLSEQSSLWSVVYVTALILISACGYLVWRSSPEQHTKQSVESRDVAPPLWKHRAKWIALAFVPSSLLLGVTTFLSTDVASTPLLWVVPLALYLLTFVIVFGRGAQSVRTPALFVHAVLVTVLALVFFWQSSLGFRPGHALHLAVFAMTALVLHGELAASRPAPAHLTEYYLWMSFGGALGGAFTAIAVPLLFESTRDYLAMLLVACFFRPTVRGRSRQPWIGYVIFPALTLSVVAKFDWESFAVAGVSMLTVVSIIAAGIMMLLKNSAARFGGALVIVAFAALQFHESRAVIFSDRSFFGIYRVTRTAGPANVLQHGTTIHGAQFLDSARRLTPLTYYHENGPVGQVFQSLQQGMTERSVAVVGLGAGTVLCYARPGEQWTFFEIDPHVEAIARDPRLFTFLSSCPVKPAVVIGDARLTMAREPQGRYSMIVLDAFSSDAIPVHLLTREAIGLYSRLLSDQGVMLVHISNRRLDLEPVVGALAEDAGLVSLIRNQNESSSVEFEYGSDWVIMARSLADLGPLASDTLWRELDVPAGTRPWTDDYSNLFSVIKW